MSTPLRTIAAPAWAALLSLAVGCLGSSSEPSSVTDPCGSQAEASSNDAYCVYRGEIIVTGFLCPESHPNQFVVGDYVVCSANASLDPALEEQLLADAPPQVSSPCPELMMCKAGADCEADPTQCESRPVKLVVLEDHSASRQCTDSQLLLPALLGEAFAGFLANENTAAAMVQYSNTVTIEPLTTDAATFDALLSPSTGLGSASDLQGALVSATELIAAAFADVPPAERAATRVVVVAVTDGYPEPSCEAGCEDDPSTCGDGQDNDDDGLTDEADPDCDGDAPDKLYGICNDSDLDPGSFESAMYVDFVAPCSEYNTVATLTDRVQALIALQTSLGLGEVSFHLRTWQQDPAVVDALCPGASQLFGYDAELAAELGAALAEAGGGTYAVHDAGGEVGLFAGVPLTPLTDLEVEMSLDVP